MTGIQDGEDGRGIRLDSVGIAGLVHPVSVCDRAGRSQTGGGTFSLSVELEASARGAHMSRFVQVLGTEAADLSAEGMREFLTRLRDALGSRTARARVDFTFFVEKTAPQSGAPSLLGCPAALEASLGDGFDFVQGVTVPVMTVCPCSREATGGPAHSQRGHVSVSVRVQGRVWFEELVELVEDSASAPVFPLLKGGDERALIGAAHENAMFVEDLVRNVAERLDSDVRILWYRVEAENLDSVHDHNLRASVERSR